MFLFSKRLRETQNKARHTAARRTRVCAGVRRLSRRFLCAGVTWSEVLEAHPSTPIYTEAAAGSAFKRQHQPPN